MAAPFQLINDPPMKGIEIGDWKIVTNKSTILTSEEITEWEAKLDLPALPEMVFGGSKVEFAHKDGVTITLRAFDALSLVDKTSEVLKVAYAEEWKKTHNTEEARDSLKPFDWTFSSEYGGSVTAPPTVSGGGKRVRTDEQINYELLKNTDEPIRFYDEVILFEDELGDNGVCMLSAKLRVMDSCFFCLLRIFLRVDGVMCRSNDTRFFHEFGQPYVLCEFQRREASVDEIERRQRITDPTMWADANQIVPLLPVKEQYVDKVQLA